MILYFSHEIPAETINASKLKVRFCRNQAPSIKFRCQIKLCSPDQFLIFLLLE